jgi:histidine ammonia-lyase/tyrosine ammonia-lyase
MPTFSEDHPQHGPELSIRDVYRWSENPEQADFPAIPEVSMQADHDGWMERMQKGEAIYGVTTGFGPLVHFTVPIEDAQRLQENLIQQLSAHTPPYLSWREANAVTIIRLFTLMRARSGARPAVAQALVRLLRSGIAPAYPVSGSVGASGDLVPLSALAGTVNGYHRAGIDRNGNTTELTAFEPLTLKPKEALALVNGTAYSAGISTLALARTRLLFSERIIPATLAVMFALDESFQHLSDAPYRFKSHSGILALLDEKSRWLKGFSPEKTPGVPQPPYSSRTWVPWMGTAMERLMQAEKLLTTELNGVDDNPLHIDGQLFHAGHFQGTFVAYAADEISQAQLLAAQLVERQLNRLMHPSHNGRLPAFLAPEPVGLNSGLQGLQLLTTSLLADIKTAAVPHTALSFPTNNDNQDIVSMSAHAAHAARNALEKLETISAALTLAVTRVFQLKSPEVLPEPLREWLTQFNDVSALDFGNIRVADVLQRCKLEV